MVIETPRPWVEVGHERRVKVFAATLWHTTSSVIVAEDGSAIVVDPAMNVAEVEALADTIRRQGWHVRAGFSTHPHWDHLLWTASLGDVPRWATSTAVQVAAARAAPARTECDELAPGHDLAFLTSATALDPGADRLPEPWGLALIEHGAHVAGHAGLVVDDVLIVGDMLSDVEVPLLGDDDDALAMYEAGLDVLEAAANRHQIAVVVPGHGTAAIGREAICERFAADRAYLNALAALADRDPTPSDGGIDARIMGYVTTWHADQLTRLRRTATADDGRGPSASPGASSSAHP